MKDEQTDKLAKVLDAIEHPEQYTDEQLQQLLSDEECTDFYRLMCDAASAFTSFHAESEAEVEEEWRRFVARTSSPFRYMLKVAAVLFAIILLSGIGYAAAYFIHNNDEVPDMARPHSSKVASRPTSNEDADSVYTFCNAELQEILALVTNHYHLLLEYHREEARHVRLYIKWNQGEKVEPILERLNKFEKVNITLSGDKIIVE